MRVLRVALVIAAIAAAPGAQAATVVVFVNPMTLDKHTEVFNTPGPDRLLMCMQPPGMTGCTELPIRRRR
jgi:hypothetical protein